MGRFATRFRSRGSAGGRHRAWIYGWECFFDVRFRQDPLLADLNTQKLWTEFECWLVKQFPRAEVIATPFNDPIAQSIEEYQAFLKDLGYSPIAKAAFGKKLKSD
jgi:hypothetical protein